nr:hypothetical protein [Desulfovibrio sp.]
PEFDIARPFRQEGETEALSLLDRAMQADPEHVHARHIGRWPDSLFNAAMVLRRLPEMALKDKDLPLGTRLRLRSVITRQTDPLFAEIVPATKPETACNGDSGKKGRGAHAAEAGTDAS